MLIKNSEKWENYFKLFKKIVKLLAWKKKGMSLLKMGFLVTLNLKERHKIDDLKLFENWSRFKIIWRKLEFWKLFENWNLKKKNLKIGVELKLFEIKLEFWNLFEEWSVKN